MRLLPLLFVLLLIPLSVASPLDFKEKYYKSGVFEVYASISSYDGYMLVKVVVNGIKPYRILVYFAGKSFNYTFNSDTYTVKISHPDIGRHRILLIVSDKYKTAKLNFYVNLFQVNIESPFISLIPLAISLSVIPEFLAYAPKKIRGRLSANVFGISGVIILLSLIMPRNFLFYYSVVSAISIVVVAYLTNRNIMRNVLEYIGITWLLIGMAIYLANPLPLIVSGIGNGIWIICVLLFPSEWKGLERLIKSVNVLYSTFMITSGFLLNSAGQISAYLMEPSWGMVKALEINISLIANMIMILPVLAPILTLSKLYATARRGKEAERIVSEISGRA